MSRGLGDVYKRQELVEFVRKLDEKMKAMLRETKENVQGANSDEKETGTQINGVDQKEETPNQKRIKKQEFEKMRRDLGTSRTSLNIPTSELYRGTRRRRGRTKD